MSMRDYTTLNIGYDLQDGFNNLRYNIPGNEINERELVNIFGYTIDFEVNEVVSGYCNSENKKIIISLSDSMEYMNSTFCHEFAHLLQDVFYEDNFETDYFRSNLPLSATLTMEQEAVNLSVQVWEWLYPNKPTPWKDMIRYYSLTDKIWYSGFMGKYFEDDLGVL